MSSERECAGIAASGTDAAPEMSTASGTGAAPGTGTAPQRAPRRRARRLSRRRVPGLAPARALGLGLGLGLVFGLAGCGVQPTGVVDAGEPASGLTRGMRLYYASEGGLRAVPLLDREVTELNSVIKLLAQGPPAAEQRDGLTSLVHLSGASATGSGSRVTVRYEGPYPADGRDLGTGQLVCTMARAQAVLDPKVRTDDVEVTIRPSDGDPLGPYRCAEFRNG
ncbi:hypothetical protein [Streptomyces buecherae]|uniref:hypothetical protein n=1 Tax=Streptomyces buecherae TaxID=2763006 RepID=UPI002FCD20E8